MEGRGGAQWRAGTHRGVECCWNDSDLKQSPACEPVGTDLDTEELLESGDRLGGQPSQLSMAAQPSSGRIGWRGMRQPVAPRAVSSLSGLRENRSFVLRGGYGFDAGRNPDCVPRAYRPLHIDSTAQQRFPSCIARLEPGAAGMSNRPPAGMRIGLDACPEWRWREDRRARPGAGSRIPGGGWRSPQVASE